MAAFNLDVKILACYRLGAKGVGAPIARVRRSGYDDLNASVTGGLPTLYLARHARGSMLCIGTLQSMRKRLRAGYTFDRTTQDLAYTLMPSKVSIAPMETQQAAEGSPKWHGRNAGSSSAMDASRKMVDVRGRDLVDHLIDEWATERPTLDTSAMPIVGRLIMIGRALEARTNAALKPFGLNYSDFDVLATLRRSGGRFELTPKQLMASVLLTSGAMTALLDRLERRNLIERGSEPTDGRVKTARLTAEGRELIDAAVVARFRDARAAIDLIEIEDRRVLEELLRNFVVQLAISSPDQEGDRE